MAGLAQFVSGQINNVRFDLQLLTQLDAEFSQNERLTGHFPPHLQVKVILKNTHKRTRQ